MTFDEAFDRLLGHEGGYSNHPDDPGAETMWGITARVARQNGYLGDMRSLPRATAKTIYRVAYWNQIKADQLPEVLRFDVFDAAVNSGNRQAIRWLQRVVGVADDGVIGQMTLDAASKCNAYAAVAAFNGERLDLMTSLPTWGQFGRGWARRVAANLKAIT